jgi:hypothetical protein
MGDNQTDSLVARVSAGGGGIGTPGTSLRVSQSDLFTSNEFIQGVVASPGWVTIGGGQYDGTTPATTTGTISRVLYATVIASTAALQVRVRLVRVTGGLLQIAILTFAAPVNAIEQYQQSADLTALLVTGDIYQIQAECTGGATGSDFATIRSAGVDAVMAF